MRTEDHTRRPCGCGACVQAGVSEPTASQGRADRRMGTRLRPERVLGIRRSRAGPGQTVSRAEGDEVMASQRLIVE
jgi:hypothetical protein